MSVAASLTDIRICFGEPETKCCVDATGLQLNLASPHLAGPKSEVLFECEDAEQVTRKNLCLLRGKGAVAGVAVIDCDPDGIESAAKLIYEELLAETAGLKLHRLWNFIPYINDESLGQEIYRSFNVGRWKAFAEAYGKTEMDQLLPAATAVGLQEESHRLAVIFLAGQDSVEYFENPRQTPAYQYPSEYGPRSPSFARGAVVASGKGRLGYLSGTSSICGCETVGAGDLEKQVCETIENIKEALSRMGFEGWPGKVAGCSLQFRVYVRDAADYPEIRQRFTEVVGEETAGQTVFVQADICRKPLKLEIEGVFRS